MRIALIDADVTAFVSAAAVEKSINWGDGLWTLHADEDEGRGLFAGSIDRIQGKVGADKIILTFSDKTNWRKEVLPTYKANRVEPRQPMIRRALTEWAREEYECFVRPTLEGDDVLGILATRQNPDGHEYIVCTIDKDLKTIPGQHYNIKHDKLFEVTEAEADAYHLTQALTGDATDGYSGCPGVGPVAAYRLLEPFIEETEAGVVGFDVKGAWQAILKAYDKKGLGEEEALVQARVARICRASDYDFKRKQVKLWTPPN